MEHFSKTKAAIYTQPFLLVLMHGDDAKEHFLIVDSTSIPVGSDSLDAFDKLFKSFYIFNVDFPACYLESCYLESTWSRQGSHPQACHLMFTRVDGARQPWQAVHLGQGQSDVKPTTRGPRCHRPSSLGYDR